MPEVAEVKLIADNLDRFLTSKRLTQLRVKDPVVLAKWVNRNCPGLSDFNKKLDSFPDGLLVKAVKTRGKFCYIECDKDIYIGISFGMSGNIRPEPTAEFLKIYKWKGQTVSKEEYLKHCHIAIEFLSSYSTDGFSEASESSVGMKNAPIRETIYYHDIRRFGRFDIYYSRADLDKKLAKLGHDPLSEDSLDNATIVAKFRRFNNQNICKVLMEQELFAGVGNFIKSETLYEARISPHAIVANIPDKNLLILYEAIKKIAKDDYESGGCALYTFSGLKGDQSDFKGTLKVYGHEGKLDVNGYVIKRIPEALSPDKRSTFWVPEIQTVGVSSVSTNSVVAIPDNAPLKIPVITKRICLAPPKVLPIIRLRNQ